MPTLIVKTREGAEKTIVADAGTSLMETLRGNGIDEIMAICGGCCSCATCHVYIDTPWLSKLEPVNSEENDLLDSSSHRNANSRLSCQIAFSDALDGMRVTVAPED